MSKTKRFLSKLLVWILVFTFVFSAAVLSAFARTFDATVRVDFLGNGGAVDPADAYRVLPAGTALGGDFPTLTPLHAGFAFRHWNTSSTLPGAAFTSDTIVNANMNAYAQWGRQIIFDLHAPELEPIPFIVVPDGVSVNDMQQTPGAPVVSWPADPVRPGFHFEGWHSNPQPMVPDPTPWTAERPITESRTIHAHWNPITPYTVIFHPNEGIIHPDHQNTRLAVPGLSVQESWFPPFLLNRDVPPTGLSWSRSSPLATRNTSNEPNLNVGNTTQSMFMTGWQTEGGQANNLFFAGGGSALPSPDATADARTVNLPVISNDAPPHAHEWYGRVDTNGELRVYARWVYRITFYPMGGSIGGDTTRDIPVTTATYDGGSIAEHGTRIVGRGLNQQLGMHLPGSIVEATDFPTVTRAGHNFLGWYNMPIAVDTPNENLPDGARRLSLNCEIDSSGAVWARWESNDLHTVTFDIGDGEWFEDNESGIREVVYDGNIRSTDNANMPILPTKPNHIFMGWFTEQNLNNPTNANAFNQDTRVRSDITVHALWLPAVTLTTHPNGAHIGPSTANGIRGVGRPFAPNPAPGVPGSLPANQQTPQERPWATGHTQAQMFGRWSDLVYARTFENPFRWGDSFGPTSARRANHVFIGWNECPLGNGAMFSPNTVINDNKDIYAIWAPTITFNNNHTSVGGVANATTTRNILYGRTLANHHLHPNTGAVPLTMPSDPGVWPQFTAADHAFVGWNTAPDGSGTWFNAATRIDYDAATGAGTGAPFTVFAIWSNGVAFNPGIAPMDSILENDRVRTVTYFPVVLGDNRWPADPIWPGHEFISWNLDPLGGGAMIDRTTEITGPITLYARWRANVTFDPDDGILEGSPRTEIHPRYIGGTIGSGSWQTAFYPGRGFSGWICPYGLPFNYDTPIMRSKTVYPLWRVNVIFTYGPGGIIVPSPPYTNNVPFYWSVNIPGSQYLTAAQIPDPQPTPNTDYIFRGWYDEEGTRVADTSAELMLLPIDRTRTLEARFGPELKHEPYIIRFNFHTNQGALLQDGAFIDVPVIPGTFQIMWPDQVLLDQALSIGNIYGTPGAPGHAFWGWFDYETLERSTRIRGALRRPALTDTCMLEVLIASVESALTSDVVDRLFGDDRRFDIYGIWSLWGDVDDSDYVNSADVDLLRLFNIFGDALPSLALNLRAANVVVDRHINSADVDLLRLYVTFGGVPFVLGQRP